MTGPEHYANAESDLEHAAHADSKGRPDDVAYWMQAAQVHAMLADAAAHALNRSGTGMSGTESDAWFAVAGTKPGRAS